MYDMYMCTTDFIVNYYWYYVITARKFDNITFNSTHFVYISNINKDF